MAVNIGSAKTKKKATSKKPAVKKGAPAKAKATPEIIGAHPETAAFLAQFAKDNDVQIQTAAQAQTPYFLRRSTGITGLDIALGGGFQAGGCVEIFGPESAGKTHLGYKTCAQVQRIYGDDTRILIFKTEMREDKDFARLSGLCVSYSETEISEMDRIRVADYKMPSFSAEELDDLRKQIGDVVYLTTSTSEHGFNAVVQALDAPGVNPGGLFQIVMIDSLGALLTKAVEEGGVEDAHYAGGGTSRVVTQFMNKVFPRLNMDKKDGSMTETTIIGINQMRAVMGKTSPNSKFAGETEKQAMSAWAWKHGLLVSLRLDKSGFFGVAGEDAAGHSVKWRTKKGKAGTHDGLRGEYDYWHFPRMRPVFWSDVTDRFLGGVALHEDLRDTAKKLGVITVSGSWLSFTVGGQEYREQGEDKMAILIAQNPEVELALREGTLRAANVMARYR